jgi:SNF2 family DNA or RNA helicase
MAHPRGAEEQLCRLLFEFLRRRAPLSAAPGECSAAPVAPHDSHTPAPLSRKQLSTLLVAAGSHPRALGQSLQNIAGNDPEARPLIELAAGIGRSAKDDKLLELLAQSPGGKLLVFANFRRTLEHLAQLLEGARVPYVTFTGAESSSEKDAAVEAFHQHVPVMLCSEAGGEGRNLQFANTLINYDLPWNPMRIEQRVGRIHRIGQTREVFIFNLCTSDSLEARILDVLNEKIRMFELVVGEVGSILGNLDGGEEFETLVLNLWLQSRDARELAVSFDSLGESLLEAQEAYLETQQLDDALFGEDYQ